MTFADAIIGIVDQQRQARVSQWDGEVGTVSALNALSDAAVLLAEEQRTANLIAAFGVGIGHEGYEALEALIVDRLDLTVERSTGGTDG